MPLIRGSSKSNTPRQSIDYEALCRQAKPFLESIVRSLLPNGKLHAYEWTACNPIRNDKRPGSFKVNIRTGKWSDFAVGEKGGDIISLIAYLHAVSQPHAAGMLIEMIGGCL